MNKELKYLQTQACQGIVQLSGFASEETIDRKINEVKSLFSKIDKKLKEKKYLDHFLDTIFDTYDDIEIVGEYDEDLRKYCVAIKFDGSELHFYCDRDEYLYWRKISGIDDQYGPEDLK